MKKNINLGAYGWLHAHWANTFYPEDLPAKTGEDWRLAFYSNEFTSVMVPCSYWQSTRAADCESWLDDVHAEFRFFIECDPVMFEFISPSQLMDCLSRLRPQLSALVFTDERSLDSELLEPFKPLIDLLAMDVFATGNVGLSLHGSTKKVWRPDSPQKSDLAFFENDLSDLRSARTTVDDFIASSVNEDTDELSIIVRHPILQASDLSQLRSVLEIMGC